MIKIPPDLVDVLAADSEARARWDDLTPLARRDFVSWIEDAKKADTRKRRVDSVPSRLASGKRRPCCYAVVPLNLHTALNANAEAKARWRSLSPDEKRDFTDWVSSATDKSMRDERAEQSVALIAAGSKGPRRS